MVFSPKSISQRPQRPKRMQLEPNVLTALKDSRTDPTQRVVEAIMRVGPRNAALLSRLTGVPTETVRYKIKKQLKEMAIKIHADVDYQRIGLRLHWAIFDFTPAYSELAVQIFLALHEIGYLIYYARIIPQGHYVVLFVPPEGSGEKYREFLQHLVNSGILRSFSFEEVVWSRHLSMNPKYFDFDSANWEIDWNKIDSDRVDLQKPAEHDEKAEVDKADLLLIKELQKDALQSIIDIARKVNIHPKTLRYHYHAHIERRALVPRYLIRWMKDIESTRGHSIIFTRVTFKGLSESELIAARSAVTRLPFTWVEYVMRNGTYLAEINIPIQSQPDTLSYISKKVTGFGQKLEVSFIDPSVANFGTIQYKVFNDDTGWIFDTQDLKQRFRNLAATLHTS